MRRFLTGWAATGLALVAMHGPAMTAGACTGLTLTAADGSVVYGRTMEWGSFDLRSRLIVTPRGQAFTSELDDAQAGKSWVTEHGFVGIDALETETPADGMNEHGLAVGFFYHPGFAEYAPFDPAAAAESVSVVDLSAYLLGTCRTVDEAKAAVEAVRVVGVFQPELGDAPPLHFFVADPAGDTLVIEFADGTPRFFQTPVGVITNAPTYDWHLTNLRNHLNLSALALPGRHVGELDFTPLGVGSGMIGLPGDFTPPSRFVRAVAFKSTARPTATGPETVYELFRILDNFNVPIHMTETDDATTPDHLRSSTLWTTAHDLRDRVLYYHTQHNRRVRMVDLKRIDFGAADALIREPLDHEPEQDIEDRTPDA